MAKYVTLGSKAEIFYDPTTRLKVLKGQVVKVDNKAKFSKKINAAIAGGHLVNVTKQQYEDYISDLGLDTKKETEKGDWREEQVLEEAVLMKLKKEQLVELAKYHETEYDDDTIITLSKAELVEEILEITQEEEE